MKTISTFSMSPIKQIAAGDEPVQRLQTHPRIGLLTSLALVHGLETVTRFGGSRKVAAYVGLEPMEHSSAGKQRFVGTSKGGSRLLRYLLAEAAHTAAKGLNHPGSLILREKGKADGVSWRGA